MDPRELPELKRLLRLLRYEPEPNPMVEWLLGMFGDWRRGKLSE